MTRTQADEDLFWAWRRLLLRVEWLCFCGIGWFFASWDGNTAEEYALNREALLAVIEQMADAGILRAERGVEMRSAVASHGERFSERAKLAELHARNGVLRKAFAPPETLARELRESVPPGPWPLPTFVAAPEDPEA